jgi:hypothetical protein
MRHNKYEGRSFNGKLHRGSGQLYEEFRAHLAQPMIPISLRVRIQVERDGGFFC